MKVLLIDDHALFAKSLAVALADFDEIACFSSIRDVEQLPRTLALEPPDILLMDIHLGRMASDDGLLLAKKLLKQFPEQKIVMLSGYDLPAYHKQAQTIGAKGFVSKDVEPHELLSILLNIQAGQTYFPHDTRLIENLTESEKQVLQLVATGIKRKQIAATLFLSERTVSNHLQHVFEKLQVTSTVEAVTKAIQLGYISPIY